MFFSKNVSLGVSYFCCLSILCLLWCWKVFYSVSWCFMLFCRIDNYISIWFVLLGLIAMFVQYGCTEMSSALAVGNYRVGRDGLLCLLLLQRRKNGKSPLRMESWPNFRGKYPSIVTVDMGSPLPQVVRRSCRRSRKLDSSCIWWYSQSCLVGLFVYNLLRLFHLFNTKYPKWIQ